MHIDKEQIKKFCEENMKTHTDWTGTYVEYNQQCESVEEFADKMWNYLKYNI